MVKKNVEKNNGKNIVNKKKRGNVQIEDHYYTATSNLLMVCIFGNCKQQINKKTKMGNC